MTRAPWVAHFGFTKLPFSKTVSAKDLLDRTSHQEAVSAGFLPTSQTHCVPCGKRIDCSNLAD